MFEKYNLSELYLGSIDVRYPDSYGWDVNVGGVLMMGMSGYGYWTILKKTGEDKFIDLQNPERQISAVRDSRITSYTIGYMEPLGNYYEQDGKKREVFSRRQAIKEARNHYNDIHKKEFELIKQRQSER